MVQTKWSCSTWFARQNHLFFLPLYFHSRLSTDSISSVALLLWSTCELQDLSDLSFNFVGPLWSHGIGNESCEYSSRRQRLGNREKDCEDHSLSHWDQYQLKMMITGYFQQEVLSKARFFQTPVINNCMPHGTQLVLRIFLWNKHGKTCWHLVLKAIRKWMICLTSWRPRLMPLPTEISCRALDIKHLEGRPWWNCGCNFHHATRSQGSCLCSLAVVSMHFSVNELLETWSCQTQSKLWHCCLLDINSQEGCFQPRRVKVAMDKWSKLPVQLNSILPSQIEVNMNMIGSWHSQQFGASQCRRRVSWLNSFALLECNLHLPKFWGSELWPSSTTKSLCVGTSMSCTGQSSRFEMLWWGLSFGFLWCQLLVLLCWALNLRGQVSNA